MRIVKVFALLLAMTLVLTLAAPVAAAPPADNPGKGPPELDQIIFIHYGKDAAPGKPDKPPKPDKPGNGKPDEEDPIDHYELSKLKLPGTVDYVINPSGSGVDYGDVESALTQGFEEWDGVTLAEVFADPSVNPEAPIGIALDDHNTISWALLSDPNIIAVTSIWYIPGKPPRTIVQFDIVFNIYHDWGIDPDANDGIQIDAMDIENIATHEAGHVVGLADLYEGKYSELTMYGYSDEGETKKRSLESGDILGAQKLYGAVP